MRIRRLETLRTRSSGNRVRNLLNFELLEARTLMACDATIDSDWDAYGNGVAHTGYVAGSIGTQFNGTIAWSREAYGRSVIHDGLLYGFLGNRLSAVDLQTGAELWTREFGALGPYGISGGDLSFDSGNLYFLLQHRDYGLLYSVNATTGETAWTRQISMQTVSRFPPVVGNGMVYVEGGTYGGLYGINQNDGSLQFFVPINDSDSWSPALYNGRLFTWADNVFAERSPDSGAVLWSIDIDRSPVTHHTNTAVVVADGLAYVVVGGTIFNDKVVAIDLQTRRVHRNVINYAPPFSPAVAHGRVYVDGAAVYQVDARSSALYPSYVTPLPYGRSTSQPIITDDAVLKSVDDRTYIFNRETRELLSTLPVGGELSLANNTLVVSTGSKLSAFSLCNAKPVTLAASLELEETAGVVEAKVSIGTKLPMNLQVQLTSANPAFLKLPSSVVIPAGATSITFPMNVINNFDRSGVSKIKITASAPSYLSSQLMITINDDESAVASNVSDAWKDFNLGINRSGYFPGELGTYLPKQPEWSAVADGSDLSISSDIVFAGRVSLDSYSGKQLWRNNFVLPGINVDGESYFLNTSTSKGRILYSVDTESGTLRWASENLHEAEKTNISVTDEWLLVGTSGGLFRVNRTSGIVEDQPVAVAFRSTIYQNTLLVTEGNYITALNLNDFSILWKHQPELAGSDYEYGGLTATNGRVAVNTEQGLRVYDIKTGTELWRVDGTFLGQPAMDNNSLFAIQLGLVIQFDAATGKRVRTFESGQQLTPNQPVITNDAIIVTSENRTFVFDRESSRVKQWFPTGGKAYLTRNFIYLYDDGVIKAYALNSPPTLALTVPELLHEGDAPQLHSAQISIPDAQASDLIVALQSDLRDRIVLPDFVTIPAGQTSTTFSLTVIDDAFDNIKSKGYVLATAKNFRSSVSVVALADDERPADGSIPGDWSFSGVDPARTSYMPGTVGTLPFPVVRWRNQSFELGEHAVASHGQVFVQAYRPDDTNRRYWPTLLAFDSASGRLNWERGIEQATIFSALTAADGHIYVAVLLDNELQVLAIEQTTGELKWKSNFGKLPSSYLLGVGGDYYPVDIVVSDGMVLLPIRSIGLLALSQESGERRYLSAFESYVPWSPAVINGRVFVWDYQTFREFDLRTGVEVWKNEISPYRETRFYAVPVLTDDTALLIDRGQLVALDINTHLVRFKIQGSFYGKAVIAADKIFAAEFDLIRTFDLKTGNALEIYAFPGWQSFEQLKQFIVTDDALIAQSSTGKVSVFSRRTTELLWTFQSDSLRMNLAEDAIYLLGRKNLVAISLRSASDYTNADVNGDNLVTPLDALFIINHLNQRTSNSNLRLDVNSNGSVTPLDALLVIDWLNKLNATTSGEGEISDQFSSDRGEADTVSLDHYFASSLEDNFVVDWITRKRRPAQWLTNEL